MINTETAFALQSRALNFELKQSKEADLDDALNIFRLSIPDNCALWLSKVDLKGEKPCWFHKDESSFANFAYLKTATDFKVGTLVIDIDHPVADCIEFIIHNTFNAPIPNLIIKNRENKHVQLIYCLKNWVCIDTSNRKGNYSAKAHAFYKALKRHLNAIFNGDDAYNNFIAKNPYSKQWDVIGMRSTAYEMYELARISELEPKSKTFIERLQATQTNKALEQGLERVIVAKGERNDFLFNTVRKHAYSSYNKYANKWTRKQFENFINDFANKLNEAKCSPALSQNEVTTICHSIVSYCYGSFGEQQRKYTKSELSEIAAKYGKKGGKAKGYKYAKQRQQARKLHKSGKKAKDIAQITGLSIRAVYNAINEEKRPKIEQKQQKNTLQKRKEKIIKYHVFKSIFCANSYQCSVFLKKELHRNYHSCVEHSEPMLLIFSLNLNSLTNLPNLSHSKNKLGLKTQNKDIFCHT